MKESKHTQNTTKNPEKSTELETMKKELEEQRKKTEEYLDALKRAQAEFDNFQKRTVKEQINFVKFAKEDMIIKMLEVADNFERALKNTDDEGVKLIHKQFTEILEKEGVAQIDEHDDFDPNIHEAVTKEKSDKKEGEIIEVFSRGYKLHDKIIRPSKVKVSGGNKK